jgi:hypothetical protein
VPNLLDDLLGRASTLREGRTLMSNNMRLILRWGSVLMVPLVLGCGPAGAGDGEPPTYRVSTDPTTEILYFSSYGGSGSFAPQYHLFGDGRLVREMVGKAFRKPQSGMSHEVLLDPTDVKLLMDLVVEAQLPDMTPERLQQAFGRRPMKMHDGATYVLRLRFESYTRQSKLVEPYTAEVKMHSPRLQARVFPDVAEVQGMNTLIEAIDGHFPESAGKVIYGPDWRGQ